MHYLGTVSSKYHPAVAMPGEGEGWRGGGNCQPGLTSDLKMNGQNPGIRAPGTTGSSCSRLQHNINKQLELQKLWLILIQFHTLVSPLASFHAIRTCNVKLVKWWPTQITWIVCFRPWKSIKWVLTISIDGTLSSVQQLFSLSWRHMCHIIDSYGWSYSIFPCCLNIFEFIFSFLKCSSGGGEAQNIFSQVHFHIPRRLSYVNK